MTSRENVQLTQYSIRSFLIFFLLIALFVGFFSPTLFSILDEYSSAPILLVFIFFLAIPVALLLVFNIQVSLFLIVLWIPLELWLFRDLQVVTRVVTWVDEGILALLTIGWIIRKLSKNQVIQRTPLDITIIFFFIVGLLSGIINRVSPLVLIFGLRAPMQYMLLYYAVVNSNVEEKFFRKLIWISVIFAFVQVPLGLYQVVTRVPVSADSGTRAGVVGQTIRAFGTFGHPNALGGFLIIFLGILVGWYFYKYIPKYLLYRLAYYVGIGMLALVFLLTFSRQSWLGLFFGFLIILFLQRRYRWLIILSVFAMSAFLLLWQFFPGFAEKNLEQLEMGDNYVRYQNFLVARSLVEISPVFGVGPGMWGGSAAAFFNSPLMEDYHIRTSQADSNWLSLIVEFGFLGSLIFFGILLGLFKLNFSAIFRISDPYWRGIFFGASIFIIGVSVLAVASPAFENQQLSFYVWLLGGISYSLRSNGPRIHEAH